MWLEAVRCAKGDEEGCPTCGGGVRRRIFGEVYAGSFVLDGERVEIRREPASGFSDPISLDPLTQYFDGGLYRLWPSERYLSRGGQRLHRNVWRAAFGDIPRGCHIHHKDGNVLNNALSNLECLPADEHLSLTWHEHRSGRTEHFNDKARTAAAAWHASPEGRLWHSRHAQRSKGWTKWKREPRACFHCGETFDCLIRANAHEQKFCSSRCKQASYRERGKSSEYAARYRERQKADREG